MVVSSAISRVDLSASPATGVVRIPSVVIICSARSTRFPSSMKRQPTLRTILSCIRPDSATSPVTSGSSASSGADARPPARAASSPSSSSCRLLITRRVSVESSSFDSSALASMQLRVDFTLPIRPLSWMTSNNSWSGLASRASGAFRKPGWVPVTLVTAWSRMRLASMVIGSSPLSSTNTVRSSRRPASARSA